MVMRWSCSAGARRWQAVTVGVDVDAARPDGVARQRQGIQVGRVVIGRDWYDLTAWHLDDAGRCQWCGTPCAGVFDGAPGTWGRKRQTIQFAVPTANAATPAR